MINIYTNNFLGYNHHSYHLHIILFMYNFSIKYSWNILLIFYYVLCKTLAPGQTLTLFIYFPNFLCKLGSPRLVSTILWFTENFTSYKSQRPYEFYLVLYLRLINIYTNNYLNYNYNSFVFFLVITWFMFLIMTFQVNVVETFLQFFITCYVKISRQARF